jgi:hypothetical protein
MITPMVARLVLDPFDRESWLFEAVFGRSEETCVR